MGINLYIRYQQRKRKRPVGIPKTYLGLTFEENKAQVSFNKFQVVNYKLQQDH